jgi:hypothetical protein
LSWVISTGGVWLLCLLLGYVFWFHLNGGVHGLDARAYWLTGHRSHLYGGPPGSYDAYLYSPAFAAAIWPLTQLPWTIFASVWMLLETVAFVWLLKPLGWRWGTPAFCLCLVEISVGNIYSFLAVAAALGLRHPAAWALPLLTKITPGLGPIWFAARREWISLAASVGATLGIALASFVITPHHWTAWLHFLLDNQGSNQFFLPVRVVLSVSLTVLAAIKGRAWLLAPAMLLGNPLVMHSWMALTLLAAIPRLRQVGAARRIADLV